MSGPEECDACAEGCSEAILSAYSLVLGAPTATARHRPLWDCADFHLSQWPDAPGAEQSSALLLGIRICRVATLLDKFTIQECEVKGLKLHEFILLMALRRIGKPYVLRPADMLKLQGVSSGTATYRLDQMVKKDLVRRIPDANDRRSFFIGLTPHGNEIVDSVLSRMRKSFHELLAPFSRIPGEFDVLEAGLRLVDACLQARPSQNETQ